MSGKLPIDRVRAAEDAPRIYEEHKQRFTEKQAKLGTSNGSASDSSPESDAPPEAVDTSADASATLVADDA